MMSFFTLKSSPSSQKLLSNFRFVCVLWFLMLLLFLFMYKMNTSSDGIIHLEALVILNAYNFVAFLNSYTISLLFIPKFLKGRFVVLRLVIGIFAIMVLYMNSTKWVTVGLHEIFPENTFIKSYFDIVSRDSTPTLISANLFRLYFAAVAVYALVILAVKSLLEQFRAEQAIRRLSSDQNNLQVGVLRSLVVSSVLLESLEYIGGDLPEEHPVHPVLQRFSGLIRFSVFDAVKTEITLHEEIQFLRDYIDLEKMRHRSDRVQITFDTTVVQKMERSIRPLVLVNFVENAFKHGVNASAGQAYVYIRLVESDGQLLFSVINNKPRVSQSAAKATAIKREGGIGLTNVRRRLQLEYPQRHSLNIIHEEDRFEVKLQLTLQDN